MAEIMIRTAQVAKHLGISPRDLREKVISKVNFGVKPGEREMPLSIASGIVRYAARALKISCSTLEEAIEAEENGKALEKEISDEVKAPVKKIEPPRPLKRAAFSTLEKLRGIGAKSQGDAGRIEKEEEDRKKKIKDGKLNAEAERKAAAEARIAERKKKREERLKEEKEGKKPGKFAQKSGGARSSSRSSSSSYSGGGRSSVHSGVTRKIEISKEDSAAAKKRREARDAERKQKKELEEQERIERKLLRKKRSEEIYTKKTGIVEIAAQLTVKEFSEKIGVPVSEVLASLMKNGIMATLVQSVDFDTASIIAEELEVTVKQEEENLSSEDLLKGDLSALLVDDEENLKERPPVVAIVGHVDHGKTSLLDAIRKTKVTDGESGGITQHIGAYSITKNGKDVTFLDTPGHEAFTSMRARGAKTADIVVLVVAADDGVKPQTIEAISHAKSAGATVIVAANKIDKESANLDKLRGELSEHHIQVEDWGGTVPMVPLSAMTGQGVDELLEMIFLQAEMMELKANPKRLAVGTVIEAHRDPSLGPVATVLVNTGTMKLRDQFILGTTWGRVRSLTDEDGNKLKTVPPSGAVRISGIDDLPNPGDIFQVLKDKKEMKVKQAEIEELKLKEKNKSMGVTDILQSIKAGNMKYLKLVVKADTTGSLEAIQQALDEIGNDEVKAKIIHGVVGGVNESDIIMASAGQGFVVSFHSQISPAARQMAEKEGVDIQEYEVIYKLIEDIEGILEGMLDPEVIETETGELKVKGIFYSKGRRQIVGGKVEKGYFEKGTQVKIMRRSEETNEFEKVGEAELTIIQHFEEKVNRIESPKECGLELQGFADEYKENDIIIGISTKTILKKLK